MKDVDKLRSVFIDLGLASRTSSDGCTLYFDTDNPRVFGSNGHSMDFVFNSNKRFSHVIIYSTPSEEWLKAKLRSLYGVKIEA